VFISRDLTRISVPFAHRGGNLTMCAGHLHRSRCLRHLRVGWSPYPGFGRYVKLHEWGSVCLAIEDVH
jgi:hypothetical protein